MKNESRDILNEVTPYEADSFRELNITVRTHIAKLYDRIDDLTTALLEKQRVLDHVAELVRQLSDADSGADRLETSEHILSVIEGS